MEIDHHALQIEKFVKALRNLGHRVADESLCWCSPIYAGHGFPTECLGQQQCRFAKEVIGETGIPEAPSLPIYSRRLGMGK